MYKTVLVAINEHLNSEIAGRYALHFAKEAGARIILCSIARMGEHDSTVQAVDASMRRLSERASELDIPHESIRETGDTVKRIAGIVERESVDLVFAATRREDIRKRFYTHTTARKLALHLPCSLALVRVVHLGRVHPKTILVPLKARLGHIEEHATFTALMASAFQSRIHLLHAAKPMSRFFHGELHLTPVEWETRLPSDIARFIEHLDRRNLGHEKRLQPGIAGKAITIEAAAKRHDLIIMGASERSLLKSLLKGNPVERVLRETTRDLIILHPKR